MKFQARSRISKPVTSRRYCGHWISPRAEGSICPYGLVFSIGYGHYRLGRRAPEADNLPELAAEYELKVPGVSRIPGWQIEARLSPAGGIALEDTDPYLPIWTPTVVGC